jgi:hypothetical protein
MGASTHLELLFSFGGNAMTRAINPANRMVSDYSIWAALGITHSPRRLANATGLVVSSGGMM